MIVTREEFADVVSLLSKEPILALDTETTGLRPYGKDELFSVILANSSREYYFNFNASRPLENPLPREWIPLLQPIFWAPGEMCAHNMKFDLHFLAKEGIEVTREMWCTEAQGRVEYNDHMKYSLEMCARRIGLEKSGAVDEYIDKYKLFDVVRSPGKKKAEKDKHFDRVPLEIIAPYACKDARLSYQLREHQQNRFQEIADSAQGPSIWQVVELEKNITRAFFHMEREGIRIDIPYCTEALEYEREREASAVAEFKKLTGVDFVDHASSLKGPLLAAGVTLGKSETGRDSAAADVLKAQRANPVVAAVLNYREAHKRGGTYFANFLKYTDAHGRIHCDLRQGGAKTGRTSSADPNLQNVPARNEDSAEYPVRRAFIPDDLFVTVDYAQVEYRLMLDYANEVTLIEEIMGGLDVHEATAKLVGLSRDSAKAINFGLLYGQGKDALAEALGVSVEEAQRMKFRYFQKLPNVKALIKQVTQTAERRGYVWNWLGRRCHCANSEFAYTIPNHMVQGGAGDIKKMAVVEVVKFLRGRKSKLLLEIHDELLLGMVRQELHLLPEIEGLMKKAYPHRRLPMSCTVAHSEKSWHDLLDGTPA